MGVGRGHVSPGKKQSNTKRATREFKKWDQDRYPLYNEHGDEFLCKEEKFVPLYDYNTQKIDKKYYVSDKGTVLSFAFHGNDKPIVMTQSYSSGYMYCGDGWHVHRLVWFSFMANAIENGEAVPDPYGSEIKAMKDLNKVARGISRNKKRMIAESVEIHHTDKNPKNNSLSNLQGVPKKIHELLHATDQADSDEERLKLIAENSAAFSEDTPTVIMQDDQSISIHEVSKSDLMANASAGFIMDIESIKWKYYADHFVRLVLDEIGYDFFNRTFSVDLITNGLKQRINTSIDDENHVKNYVVRGLVENEDPDIIVDCDQGKFVLPQYTFD